MLNPEQKVPLAMIKYQLKKTVEEFRVAYASKTKVAGYNIRHAHGWLISYPRIALTYATLIVIVSMILGNGGLSVVSGLFVGWFCYCAYKGLKSNQIPPQ